MVAVIDEAFAQTALPRRGSDRPRDRHRQRHRRLLRDRRRRRQRPPRGARRRAAADDVRAVPHGRVQHDVDDGADDGRADGFAAAARQAVREIDARCRPSRWRRSTEVVTESVAQRRFSMLLLAVFAVVALFLAAVGLYGVVAYAVSQRTQEIGLRMAIGAQRGDVLRMVLGGGMKLAVVGVVLGLGAALALARLPGSMLFGVTPFDAVSYAATAAVLLARVRARLLRPRPARHGRRSAQALRTQ